MFAAVYFAGIGAGHLHPRTNIVRGYYFRQPAILIVAGVFLPSVLLGQDHVGHAGPLFEVSYASSVHPGSVTGRVFVAISRKQTPEPRLQAGEISGKFVWDEPPMTPFFGVDVTGLRPGVVAQITRTAAGFPLSSLDALPPGDYWVQAFLTVYSEFKRADGHTLWLHEDHWEGQKFNDAPGNLISAPLRIHLDARAGYRVKLALTQVQGPVTVPPDDEYVKYEKIQSRMLSAFWGRPMYLGAVVLLPRGYAQHPNVRYPGIWLQTHFEELATPFEFRRTPHPETEEDRRKRMAESDQEGTPWEFSQAWMGEGFPRLIAVRILHPTPYYDDSYAVNSVNTGPYWDAIHTELMPYLESKYRLISQPYARVLTGGSTGGWEALALQVYHPDVFGGTWAFYPDPVDFHSYEIINLYEDRNAYTFPRSEWLQQERASERMPDGQVNLTVRQETQLNTATGSRLRGGGDFANWQAVWGPMANDGYPKPVWDAQSGAIDHQVVEYWRAHDFDLTDYLKRNWSRVGTAVQGQIHLYNPDMDRYFLNLAVYRLEAFLRATRNPTSDAEVLSGRPLKTHGWHPMSNAQLVRIMAEHISAHAPANEPPARWHY